MNKDNRPLVSVIIATYHRADSLYNALSSIAKQVYNNIEIIVVDDNADKEWNESVEKIINRIKNNYPSASLLYVCNEKNMGSAGTRNIGIRKANGDYITFLDDDDVYQPEKVEKQVNDMISSRADYGITDLYLYDRNEKLVERRVRSYIKETDKKSLIRYHLKYHLTGTDTLMFRTEYLKQIGMFPPINVGDEFFLMEKAITNGGKLVYSPHCYVKAFIHDGEEEGLSSGEHKIQGENALHEEKKKHFSELSKKDIRYINVRHHMVIAYAQLRKRNKRLAIKHGIIATIISPIDVFLILKQRA